MIKHIVSLAIITTSRGECLLQYRDAGAPLDPNQWALFGGHKEEDEAPIETIIRELREEIGLSFAPERFRYLGEFSDAAHGGSKVSLYHLLLAEGEKAGIKLGEGGGYRFFSSKEEILGLPMPDWERETLTKFLKK